MSIDIRTIQNIELQILKDFVALLKKNNIDYFLAYGTTLGCVRHNGFIPWDDDIDVYIWGKDYEKIRSIFEKENTGYLKFHDYATVDGYPYVFPKVIDSRTILKEKEFEHLAYECGIYVDVFPLFEVPNNKLLRRISEKIRYFRYAIVRMAYLSGGEIGGTKKYVAKLIKKLVNVNKIQHKLFNTYTNQNIKGELLAEPNIFKEKKLVKKQYFADSCKMIFEDTQMPIPIDYKGYLKSVYGDYMQLPKEEDRVPCHSFSKLIINNEEV